MEPNAKIVALDSLNDLADSVARMFLGNPFLSVSGRVVAVASNMVQVAGISKFVRLGDRLQMTRDGTTYEAEIIRIDPETVKATLFLDNSSIALDMRAYLSQPGQIAPDQTWKGRIINAICEPLDNKGLLRPGARTMALDGQALGPLARSRLNNRLCTGVRAIDLFTPVCSGQRVGLFSGSGIGKSTLLGMLSKCNQFDIVVAALVGERGREVREFIEDVVATNIENSIVVVSTSDESSMMRRLAPRTATTLAEYFRDLGMSVCLIVDSIARFAQAERDILLAAGEPPVSRGFPPGVFSAIPRLLERAGPGPDGGGSITAFYTVLVEGDDHNDPIADHLRGTLDGHIVLSRAIAEQSRYPAIDVLKSLSRLAPRLWTKEEKLLVSYIRDSVVKYEDTRDLRLIGGYTPGLSPSLDKIMNLVPSIYEFLKQDYVDDPEFDVFQQIRLLVNHAA